MEELPDKIYVSLGRRGFDPIKLKYCHVCKNPVVQDLELLKKEVIEEKSIDDNTMIEVNYKFQDKKCGGIFYIKLKHMYKTFNGKKKRITTLVNILDKDKNDLGWLGNY
ncbi:MAG: hypothetical protein ACTSVY_01000 [Candidatus Helarchaeota archaeon]